MIERSETQQAVQELKTAWEHIRTALLALSQRRATEHQSTVLDRVVTYVSHDAGEGSPRTRSEIHVARIDATAKMPAVVIQRIEGAPAEREWKIIVGGQSFDLTSQPEIAKSIAAILTPIDNELQRRVMDAGDQGQANVDLAKKQLLKEFNDLLATTGLATEVK